MRTNYAHRQETSSNHPLNGGLGGYCGGKLHWVPWAAGYGTKLQDMLGSLQRHMAGEPHTLYQEVALPLQAKEMGPPV
jgi:hypothetical protein